METIPKKVNEILDDYFKLLEMKLPNLMDAYYLYGSVSLATFKEGFSDIDFIAVVKQKLSEDEVEILKEIHKEMQRKYPSPILDGFYFTKDDFASLNSAKISGIRFNDGKCYGNSFFDKNSIDAYQLKKYGITIKGQKIEDVDYTVDWEILMNNMRNNLNTYWLGWMSDCKRFPSLKSISLLSSLGMVEWGVLGVSRLYYSFIEKDIISKVGAGEYAVARVPEKYHKIINESLRLRKGNKKSYYQSLFKRRKDTVDYIEFMIQECNSLFREQSQI